MNNAQEYIEAYFNEQLNEAQKRQFEEQCVRDESFAREVAHYITISEGVRQKLLKQKKTQWSGDGHDSRRNISTVSGIATLRQWLPYMAAACLLIALVIFLLNRSETPHKLAGNYVNENFMQLSQTMSASGDSLQLGIAAYNDKDYGKALLTFQKIAQSHPDSINAKKIYWACLPCNKQLR